MKNSSERLIEDRLQHLCRWIGNCPPIFRFRDDRLDDDSREACSCGESKSLERFYDGGALLLAI